MHRLSLSENSAQPSTSSACSHYKRNVKFVTPCCDKIYTCRFCHDESESHELNRKKIQTVICTNCNKRQVMGTRCRYCLNRFGEYMCMECILFDDYKLQFHCKDCGICRVGGRENFFHCPTCNLCLNIRLLGAHKCIENSSRTDCPICLEYLHTSRQSLHIPKCGHLIHEACYKSFIEANIKECPICKVPYNENS